MKSLIIILFASLALFSGYESLEYDWKLIKEKEEIEVFARKTYTGFKAVKVNAIIHTDVNHFLDVINDANRYKDWVYGCSDSKTLYDEGNIIEYSTLTDMPFPVSDRYLEVRSTQEFSGNLWTSRSYSKKVAPPSRNVVVVDVFESEWIVVDNGDFLNIEYEVFSEPGGHIPAWIYNLAVSRGPLYTMNNLKILLETENSDLLISHK